MKQFILFGGCDYYAEGGLNDFIADYEKLQDAIDAAERLMASKSCRDWVEWWHVFDLEYKDIVAHSANQAYGANDAMANNGKPTLKRKFNL